MRGSHKGNRIAINNTFLLDAHRCYHDRTHYTQGKSSSYYYIGIPY
jgi:hypothetical protein